MHEAWLITFENYSSFLCVLGIMCLTANQLLENIAYLSGANGN